MQCLSQKCDNVTALAYEENQVCRTALKQVDASDLGNPDSSLLVGKPE